MNKVNCWEFKACGREPGGKRVAACGVCPAAIHGLYDNANGGVAAGRFCWAIAGTFCDDRIAGTFAEKMQDCLQCEFFKLVGAEEGRNFVITRTRFEDNMDVSRFSLDK